MKKFIAVASVLCMLALASCSRKDYVCACTDVLGSKTMIQQYDQSLNEAKMECDDHDQELTTMGERKFTDCMIN